MGEKEKIQVLADTIENLLQQVDMFTLVLTKDDFKLLEKARDSLKDKIIYKQSATPLLYAIGINPDTTEDEMKLKTLDLVIELMKTRIQFKEEMTKLQQNNKNKQDAINLFKGMGIL